MTSHGVKVPAEMPADRDSRPRIVPPRPPRVPFARATDTLVMIGLALAVIVTRFPVRSRHAFNWDAVNFVLAVDHYDVRLHHPHPPGYPVFVAAGWLLSHVIPDANGALVAVAMLLSVGAVVALFLIGKTLHDQATGIVAAVYLLFSVTFWTNGAVALAYASLACFGTLVALCAWRLRAASDAEHTASGIVRYSLLLSAAYAIGGGFRPDLLLFLAPLWIWGHWRAGWLRVCTSACVAVAIIACWALPMVVLSGGVNEYLKVFRAYTAADVLQRYSVAENGPRALIINARDTATYTGYALYALVLPVTCALLWMIVRALERRHQHGQLRSELSGTRGTHATRNLITFFVLWIAPMLLFYTWVHVGDPGYVFTFVPALLLLAAWFTVSVVRRALAIRTDEARRSRPHPAMGYLVPVAACLLLIALPIVANTAIFLRRPLALTAPGIRQQDQTIDAKLAYVHAHGDPARTLLVSYESYRHWLLYLPEYRTQFVDVTYGTEADRTLAVPAGITQVILMDDTLIRALADVQPTDTLPIARDRVAALPAPASPLRFAPLASPLGAPHR